MLNQDLIASVEPDGETEPSLRGWRVDAQRNRLVGPDGKTIALEPRVMQTLLVLLAQPGETIPRDMLIRRIWGHAHVTDDALTRCVALLRKALEGMPAPQPHIETVPRVGYALHLPESKRLRASPRILAAGGVVVALGVAVIAMLWRAPPAPVGPPRIVPLTSLDGMEVEPSFSPDSGQVVYSHKADDGRWRLHVQAVANGSPRPLDAGPGDAVAPRWSPNGGSIAFLRFERNDCTVMQIAASGGPPRRLADCDPRSNHSLAWTPDGAKLIFTPPQAGSRGLALLDLESLEHDLITRPADAEIGDANPAVSLDGRQLTFTRWHDYGVGDLFLADLDGGNLLRLTEDGVKVHGSTWDGGGIVFASNRTGDFRLWRIDTVGSPARPLPVGGREIDGPVVSPDGRWLAYEEWLDQADVWREPLAGGPGEVLVGSSRWDWGARLAPDGNRLAFVSDRSGAPEIWVSAADGTRALQLTDNGGAYSNRPAWSPNGKHIAFEAPVDGQFDLYQVPAEGGPVRRLTDHPGSDRFAQWLPAGGALLFGSTRSGAWQIWRLDRDSGELQQVTSEGGSVPWLDAESGWLYVSHCRDGGLWRERPGGLREPLFPDLLPIDCAAWTLAHGAVYLVARDPSSRAPSLARLDLDTRELQVLGAFDDFDHRAGFEIIGGDLIYTRVRHRQVDLMMVDRRSPR